jgi:uncharacterized protein YegL
VAGRRLPIYLVLDVSNSMAGVPIEAVRQGVRMFVADLRSNPTTTVAIHLSVITFSDTAQQVVPLTGLAEFQEPSINASDAGGGCALGAALEELLSCVEREFLKQTLAQKGDYKPLVFLMTNGRPTDTWEAAADKVKNRRWNVIACAARLGADLSVLKRFSEMPVELSDCRPSPLLQIVKWSCMSWAPPPHAAHRGAAGVSTGLPPPPGDQVIP